MVILTVHRQHIGYILHEYDLYITSPPTIIDQIWQDDYNVDFNKRFMWILKRACSDRVMRYIPVQPEDHHYLSSQLVFQATLFTYNAHSLRLTNLIYTTTAHQWKNICIRAHQNNNVDEDTWLLLYRVNDSV